MTNHSQEEDICSRCGEEHTPVQGCEWPPVPAYKENQPALTEEVCEKNCPDFNGMASLHKEQCNCSCHRRIPCRSMSENPRWQKGMERATGKSFAKSSTESWKDKYRDAAIRIICTAIGVFIGIVACIWFLDHVRFIVTI